MFMNFSSIYKKYDILNHLLSFGVDFYWRYILVKSVISGPNKKMLDMAAGTLDVSMALSDEFRDCQIVAGDICSEMLEHGKTKLKGLQKEQIKVEIINAEEIPYPDHTFDASTIAFGIRNVQDRDKALKELNRTLAIGGQLHILEFSPVTMPIFKNLYNFYLEKCIPVLVKLLKSDPEQYKYLARSIQEFPSSDDFSKQIANAGFQFVKYEKLTLGIVTLYTATKS